MTSQEQEAAGPSITEEEAADKYAALTAEREGAEERLKEWAKEMRTINCPHTMSILGPFCIWCHRDWEEIEPGWDEKYRKQAEEERFRQFMENAQRVMVMSGYPTLEIDDEST